MSAAETVANPLCLSQALICRTIRLGIRTPVGKFGGPRLPHPPLYSPHFLNNSKIMSSSADKIAIAKKIAQELRSRPENQAVDSSWYCIAVSTLIWFAG